ncbi:biliverdin-producing heme oxygenase [Sphingomonas sp. KR1UV-12]|uniref:Biliverdin-producing heme oxygenase n=1 Tax=Sphingomonas aurea TaxID=3063994 RepID=A0ABT9ENI7_9SPHN|nr:biliverdin-producing heme oxygenase [Sphingomonas sp. KR1UV-12]MDP1028512.1 biliverdin-producing heme oxygenase [Sphingomonas sp. KR1UV-12]
MSAVQQLRAATSASHDRVDAAFGGYDLTDPIAYAAFLTAHARALPAAEAVLARHDELPAWRERTSLLAADLADLDLSTPVPLPFTLPERPGAAWGALYVIEGSRLGGTMLARGVPAALPSRYLAARHLSGEWRALLAAIDARGADAVWRDGLLAGAHATFDLYSQAAAS